MSDVSQGIANLSPEEKRALLAKMLQKKVGASKAAHPLSYGQQSMWLMHQFAPDSAAYNVAFTARIRSAVDVPALKRAFQLLVDRHASLRTTFTTRSGQPVQEIHTHGEAAFEEIDASASNEYELDTQVIQTCRRPFDLGRGPLLRVSLFTRSTTEHILVITAHHIALDGWSVWICLDELRRLYTAEITGTPAILPSVSIQYTDFVDWHAKMLAGPEGERLWTYWQKQLAGELPVLNLPTDRPRPAIQTYQGATHEFVLDEELSQQIRALATARQTTVYTILLATFQVLLHRYTGQDDILIGSPVAGRSRAEFAEIVGDLINMIVLRGDLSGDPAFTIFLDRMRQTVLGALDHQDYPFLLLVERLVKSHDPSRSPIFQVAFNLQQPQRLGELPNPLTPGKAKEQIDASNLALEPFLMPQQEGQFDLTLQMIEASNSLVAGLQYNTDLFDASTIARMQRHFQTLLEGIVANPERRISELPLLTEAERHQLLIEWNDTQANYARDTCFHHLFEAQVKRTPDAIAVTYEDQFYTYHELNQRANQLAHYLKSLGVGPETLVGICVERSLDMLVGLLGILKAGGTYIPLDPAFPQERLALMLEDSQPLVLLTQQRLLTDLPFHQARVVCLDTDRDTIAQQSMDNFSTGVTAEHLAYVLYTSGSTGTPKGVQIPRRALTNLLLSMQQEPGVTEQDVLLAVTTLSFDIAGLELYLPLTVGGRVVIVSQQVASDGSLLLKQLVECGATVMQATPATWRMLMDSGWRSTPGLKMLCGGEALPRDLANQMLERGGSLWNMYGPTETTIWSSTYQVKRDNAPIHLGHPIANTQFYVLDSHLQPVPIAVPGELYIGGDGIARGYLRRSNLTAERFLDNPFMPGKRLYKTGDLARYHADGTLEFLGRADLQVKVRGFRIELGDIEAALLRHEQVKQAAVVARDIEHAPGDKQLVGYIIPASTPAPTASELRVFLKTKLPDYMVPSLFVALDAFPLTPNGKIDRRALPAPERVQAELSSAYVAPRSPVEDILASLWAQVLHVAQVGVHDNFFESGGHSLLAMQVMSRVQDAFQMDVPLIDLFERPTVGELAKYIEERISTIQKLQSPIQAASEEREELEL